MIQYIRDLIETKQLWQTHIGYSQCLGGKTRTTHSSQLAGIQNECETIGRQCNLVTFLSAVIQQRQLIALQYPLHHLIGFKVKTSDQSLMTAQFFIIYGTIITYSLYEMREKDRQIETDRQTDIQIQRQTDRQTERDRQTYRYRDRQTERERERQTNIQTKTKTDKQMRGWKLPCSMAVQNNGAICVLHQINQRKLELN